MYLEKINSPEDIKNFTSQQREELAAEMREAMLKRASVHGVISVLILALWRQLLPCIRCLIRQRINLSLISPIRLIPIRC